MAGYDVIIIYSQLTSTNYCLVFSLILMSVLILVFALLIPKHFALFVSGFVCIGFFGAKMEKTSNANASAAQ